NNTVDPTPQSGLEAITNAARERERRRSCVSFPQKRPTAHRFGHLADREKAAAVRSGAAGLAALAAAYARLPCPRSRRSHSSRAGHPGVREYYDHRTLSARAAQRELQPLSAVV